MPSLTRLEEPVSAEQMSEPFDEDISDDILYFARSNDLASLRGVLKPHIQRDGPSSTVAGLVATLLDDYTGNNVVHLAAANGCLDVLRYLVGVNAGQASDAENVESAQGLDKGSASLAASSLIVQVNSAGNTPLHYAAMNAQLDAVKILVKMLPTSKDVESQKPRVTRAEFVQIRNKAQLTAAEEAEAAGKEGCEAVAGFLDAAVDVPSVDDELNVSVQVEEERATAKGLQDSTSKMTGLRVED